MANKACQECHLITEDKECPSCGSGELSRDWQGSVIILDPDQSWIASEMNVKTPGRYALKVRT